MADVQPQGQQIPMDLVCKIYGQDTLLPKVQIEQQIQLITQLQQEIETLKANQK